MAKKGSSGSKSTASTSSKVTTNPTAIEGESSTMDDMPSGTRAAKKRSRQAAAAAAASSSTGSAVKDEKPSSSTRTKPKAPTSSSSAAAATTTTTVDDVPMEVEEPIISGGAGDMSDEGLAEMAMMEVDEDFSGEDDESEEDDGEGGRMEEDEEEEEAGEQTQEDGVLAGARAVSDLLAGIIEDDDDDDDPENDGDPTPAGEDGESARNREAEEIAAAAAQQIEQDEEDERELQAQMALDAVAAASGSAGGHRGGDDGFRQGLFGLAGYSSMMSGMSARLKTMLNTLKNHSPDADSSAKLIALQDLSELLSISTEDTLAGYFSVDAFVKELVYVLKGNPDEFAIAEEGNVEMMLLACRCLANLMEALPGSAHTVVHNGAVPVLCAKLLEIQFIDLAEQTLSVSHCQHSVRTIADV